MVKADVNETGCGRLAMQDDSGWGRWLGLGRRMTGVLLATAVGSRGVGFGGGDRKRWRASWGVAAVSGGGGL